MRKYQSWIRSLINRYPTTLDEDEALLAIVEQKPEDYFWMYQFVLTYRIGQKSILREQLYASGIILKALEKAQGDRDIFVKET